MKYRSNLDRVPDRLLHECGFCHKRGLRPGLVEIEFPYDQGTKDRLHRFAQELLLDEMGFCGDCQEVLANSSVRRT